MRSVADEGAIYYAIASVLERIIEAILCDLRAVMTVSNAVGRAQGLLELEGVCGSRVLSLLKPSENDRQGWFGGGLYLRYFLVSRPIFAQLEGAISNALRPISKSSLKCFCTVCAPALARFARGIVG